MISATILVKNSSRHIRQVLAALTQFDEVLLFDTGSTDNTLNIASDFKNVRIEFGDFIGFGPTHNRASLLAKNNWVLSIDSDEVLTEALVNEIKALPLDASCVYSIARNNFYRGKHIKGCGWYPDRVVRLYDKTKTCFSDDLVHEKIITTHATVCNLQEPLLHYPYNSINDFLAKMQSYTTLFAKQHEGKKKGSKKGSMPAALMHGFAAFMKSYLLKNGVLFGSEGLEISLYNAITAYYKYLKLRDMSSNTRL